MSTVLLRALVSEAEAAFGRVQPIEIARALSRSLLAQILGKSEAWIASSGSSPISSIEAKRIHPLLLRAAKGEPIAYLLGTAQFYDRPFFVTRATLIPRPETEQLVDLILNQWPTSEKNCLAIDIGTGSGCIGTTLALKRSASNIIMTDVSVRALRVAKKNLETHLGRNASDVILAQTSLFGRAVQHVVGSKRIQHLLIAANLPYLPDSDRKALSKSVTKFEPHKALFGGKRGEELVVTLLKQIHRFSKTHPKMRLDLVLEFDPPQAKLLERFAQTLFPKAVIRIEKDGFERDRFLTLSLLTPQN